MKTLLSCVTLDLETTGLSPESDTIIEIAAIKYDIIFENNTFRLENIDERSMLVNPEIPLSEEVTLITGISENMLEWKSKWSDIQQKVADFIGENSVIVGHNVFFDLAMLKTHGLDLYHHHILDTFELSEIFSQDATSLNLGFLGDFYGIKKRGAEHRALTDTWITTDLLLHYLSHIRKLEDYKKSIWENYALRSDSPLHFLEKFFEKNSENDFENWKKNFLTTPYLSEKKLSELKNTEKKFAIFSLENSPESEIDILWKYQKKYGKIHIITSNKKTAEYLSHKFSAKNIACGIAFGEYQLIHAEEIFAELEKTHENRKYNIFLLKMAFWLTDTKTGIVGELKYYGEEFEFLEKFRLTKDETNIFRKKFEEDISKKNIILEAFHKNIELKGFPIYKDISLLEGVMRKAFSHTVDFEKLVKNIEKFLGKASEDLIHSVRTLEAIYQNTANRPTGESVIPPGKYGETYFLTQNELWSRGCKWLSVGNRGLYSTFVEWKNENEQTENRAKNIAKNAICRDIEMLISYETQECPDLGVIMSIVNDETTLEFISRKLWSESRAYFQNGLGYGYHLQDESIKKLLETEIPAENIEFIPSEMGTQITEFQTIQKSLSANKILILTTSMKHIREIGAKLSSLCDTALLQWTSGGKSKMKHYFSQDTEKAILVGLIDSWRDEFDILEKVDSVIIAKIPFDPPTDPYFLAKTIGIGNSFELYSKPIVLSRLNTLIGNIKTANPNAKIICADDRVETTEWGKFMKKNLM